MKMGAEFWESYVAAAKRETKSASEYARLHGISVAALYYWQHKLKSTTAITPNKVSKLAKPAHVSSFVELRVPDKVVVPPCLFVQHAQFHEEVKDGRVICQHKKYRQCP